MARLFASLDDAIGWSLDVLVENNFTNGIGNDVTLTRILDRSDVATDVGIDLRVLESEVGVGSHLAILESEIVSIAERLGLDDLAIDESQAIGVPSEVFAVEGGVDNSNVLGIPEGVFSIEGRVADCDVLAILERVVAVQRQVVNLDILAMHKDVVALVDLNVLEFDVLAMPKSLGRMEEFDVLELYAVHIAEHLGSLDNGISHQEVARVPQSGASSFGKEAIVYPKTIAAPERVFALETAPLGLDITGLLEAALALVDSNVLETEIGCTIERALAFELLIFYDIHILSLCLIAQKNFTSKIRNTDENNTYLNYFLSTPLSQLPHLRRARKIRPRKQISIHMAVHTPASPIRGANI